MLFGSFQHMHLSVLSMGHGWQLILLSKCLLFSGLSMHALLGGKPEFIYHFMRPLSWAPPLYNFPEISGSLASLKVLWSGTRSLVCLHCFILAMTLPGSEVKEWEVKEGEKKEQWLFIADPCDTAYVGRQKVPLLESLHAWKPLLLSPHHCQPLLNKTSPLDYYCYFFKNYFCCDIIHIS